MRNLPEHSITAPSCRLYAILARSAPIGVVFRRGPSRWVQVIKWDTNTDTFEAGQWFHGRIYERDCDLAPDGSLLIYSVNKFTGRILNDREQTYNYWAAISKPPYLTALALWPALWAPGGALFVNASEVWLNQDRSEPHPDHQPPAWLRVRPHQDRPTAWGEGDIESQRRLRDGWRGVQGDSSFSKTVSEKTKIWERPSRNGNNLLVYERPSVFRGFSGRYELRLLDGIRVSLPGAEWADWDHRGRLVFSREGALFTGEIVDGKLQQILLADFGANRPQAIEAPPWAKTW